MALIAALEDVVMGDAPAFTRLYAGARLVLPWNSMRWGDPLGVHPALLVQRARGLLGQLEQTKMSGSDKQALILPMLVSSNAFLVKPDWLSTWRAHKHAFTRSGGRMRPRSNSLVPFRNTT